MAAVIVGIAGGTGAGKTVLAQAILKAIGENRGALICQDAYYHEHSHLSASERARGNYDRPDAFDMALLTEHLQQLRDGKSIPRMRYDYHTHSRMNGGGMIGPVGLAILEGILVLHDEALRQLMDLKIFVDTPADVRIIRRLERDLGERGRTFESVVEQYLATVRPMHQAFVEPSRTHADVVMSGQKPFPLEGIVAQIEKLMGTPQQSGGT